MFSRSPARKPIYPRSSQALSAVGVVALLIGAGLVAPAVAAPSKSDVPMVVGLGDSFTSGVGTTDVDPASGACRRSFDSYPLEAARLLGASGANAACSGAEVAAISQPFNAQLPQAEHVGDADAVVMTLGGNDVLSLGNATSLLWNEANVVDELMLLEPQLAEAFTAVRAATPPEAPVLVLAYPNMFPAVASGNCPAVLNTILPAAHRGFELLNASVERQAIAAGLTFLDTSDAFVGHDVCSPDPWATGIEDWNIALHPNSAGHAALGAIVASELEPFLNSTDTVTAESPENTRAANVPAPVIKPRATDVPLVKGDSAVLGAPAETEPAHSTGEAHSGTAPDHQAAQASAPEELAATGSSTTTMLFAGTSLMAVGLLVIWLRLGLTAQPVLARNSQAKGVRGSR